MLQKAFLPFYSISPWFGTNQIGGFLVVDYPAADDLYLDIFVEYHPSRDNPREVEVLRFTTQLLRKIEDGSEKVFETQIHNQLLEKYTLSQVLSTLGFPDQVYIVTAARKPSRTTWWPFRVFVPYSELGIFIEYTSPLERVGDDVIGCPLEAHIDFWLASPEKKASYSQIFSNIGGWEYKKFPDFPDYKPLEEATGMTLEMFYQTFRDPNNLLCLETPADMWTEPD